MQCKALSYLLLQVCVDEERTFSRGIRRCRRKALSRQKTGAIRRTPPRTPSHRLNLGYLGIGVREFSEDLDI